MPKRLSKHDHATAEMLYKHAQEAQTLFWNLVSDIEQIAEVSISADLDLCDYDLDYFRERGERI